MRYDQLRQQVNQTTVAQQAIETASQSTSQDYAAAVRLSRFLTRSIPAYNAGEERASTTDWLVLSMSTLLRSPMKILCQVTPQKREKMDLAEPAEGGASASSHPFSIEAALKQAVENAKISHIHHGGLSTDYTEQQWESYVKTKKSSAAGH